MRVEGTGGAAVTRINDPEFQMFETHSGRDIHSDLERAHRPLESPIKLKPLTKAEEATLYSGNRPAPRKATSPRRQRGPREPAPPARLPAPRPGPVTVEAVGPSAPPPADQAGRGQTTRKSRNRFDHDAILRAYQQGASRPEVAKQFNCSWQLVNNVLLAAGEEPRPRPAKVRPPRVTPVRRLEHVAIVTAYCDGQPMGEIASQNGCSVPTIVNILNTWHVVRWPRKGRQSVGAAMQAADPAPDLAAAGAAIVDHLHDRVSLPTTVRRLIQAGFSTAEVAVYCGVDETVEASA